MADDDAGPDMDELRRWVEQAHADVRRAESVGPAATLGLVAACLPLLIVLVAAAANWTYP
jgi:hypothetical protein